MLPVPPPLLLLLLLLPRRALPARAPRPTATAFLLLLLSEAIGLVFAFAGPCYKAQQLGRPGPLWLETALSPARAGPRWTVGKGGNACMENACTCESLTKEWDAVDRSPATATRPWGAVQPHVDQDWGLKLAPPKLS